jgi:hypothetical protein
MWSLISIGALLVPTGVAKPNRTAITLVHLCWCVAGGLLVSLAR